MKPLKQKQKDELEHVIRTSKKTKEVLRAQAILMLDEGDSHIKVKRMTGFSKTHAFHLRRTYLKNGIESLKDKREGKPKQLLTNKQRAVVLETVKMKTPEDCGFVSEHWSTGILGEWIKKKFKVEYKSKTSLYLVFKQAKFTYHRPGQAYDLRDEQKIEDWKTKNKPSLKRFWNEKETVILCADEMILTTATTIQKVWLPQGEFPTITCKTGGRKRKNVYGFLNLKTGDEHAFKTDFQNMHVTVDVLKKVRNIYPTQKIILYWDNAGWHRGSAVQNWIKQDGNLKVIHFPTYAPELNPQEHVWKSGRSAVTHNRYIENIDEATDELIGYFKEMRFYYSLLGMSANS
jgi:transposase